MTLSDDVKSNTADSEHILYRVGENRSVMDSSGRYRACGIEKTHWIS